MVMISYEREIGSTYPCRSLRGEALRNVVDVVVRLRDPNPRRPTIRPDLAPNGRHLRVHHTYNSMTISTFLIQQERRRGSQILRQHDSVAMMMVELLRRGFVVPYRSSYEVSQSSGGREVCTKALGAKTLSNLYYI